MSFLINSANPDQSAPAITGADPSAALGSPTAPDADNGPQFEIKLKVSQSEVDQAVSALRDAGMDTFADMLAKAMPKADPNAMDATSQGLQDDIVAMQPRN